MASKLIVRRMEKWLEQADGCLAPEKPNNNVTHKIDPTFDGEPPSVSGIYLLTNSQPPRLILQAGMVGASDCGIAKTDSQPCS